MSADLLPFTRDQFFEVFAAYNAVTWPAAILAYPLAALAVFMAWRGTAPGGRVATIILALMWAWVGAIYQGIYFSQINPIARAFAGAFVLQALLFAIHAIIGRGLEFGTKSRVRAVAGASMVLYAMLMYPLIGMAVEERYPAMPFFGVTPCPLLIFTFGLMLWTSGVRWWLWIVPMLWAAIGGSAAFLLSVPQDWALPVSGLFTLAIIWLDRSHRPTAQSF